MSRRRVRSASYRARRVLRRQASAARRADRQFIVSLELEAQLKTERLQSANT